MEQPLHAQEGGENSETIAGPRHALGAQNKEATAARLRPLEEIIHLWT